ncbi:MAG: type II toxin-antitoxin system PemK/MazF family toxin [Chloroflexota bacterium]|nr:type II toxin-antitoxin system PemK/MazF family toxin [Chloroflexota bacterium]PLS83059.1 MAG: PemK family transcriptional regulator [Chloroflexota bacterium]
MKQGDVYWYTFRAPDKRRPVLVLTRNSALQFLTGITIAPITSTIRGIPSEVILSVADGLFNDCAANFDNIQTVQQANIGTFITHLSGAKMRDVRAAIEFALGFDALT